MRTVTTMRPGLTVNETLCQPSPLAHRLVSTNPKNAPTFSVTLRDDPKVLQCLSFISFLKDVVENAYSPVAAITPDRRLL